MTTNFLRNSKRLITVKRSFLKYPAYPKAYSDSDKRKLFDAVVYYREEKVVVKKVFLYIVGAAGFIGLIVLLASL
jgi:hypothetical protein